MDIALASECGALAFIILASVLSVTTLFQKYPFKALILVQAGAQIAAGKIEGFFHGHIKLWESKQFLPYNLFHFKEGKIKMTYPI